MVDFGTALGAPSGEGAGRRISPGIGLQPGPLGGETIEANPPAVAVSMGTEAARITSTSGPGRTPKRMATNAPTAIGISIDRPAGTRRRAPVASRRNIALSTRT